MHSWYFELLFEIFILGLISTLFIGLALYILNKLYYRLKLPLSTRLNRVGLTHFIIKIYKRVYEKTK